MRMHNVMTGGLVTASRINALQSLGASFLCREIAAATSTELLKSACKQPPVGCNVLLRLCGRTVGKSCRDLLRLTYCAGFVA